MPRRVVIFAPMAMQEFSGYRILEVLRDGPRATVYKARDPKSRAVVAVKLFHDLSPDSAGRFPRLQHPHVAQVFAVGQSDSQVFVVSEFLPGGTLKDHIRSLRSVGDLFPADQVLDYARQIADALLYARAQGLGHGNLKGENILFAEDGTLKLSDFATEAPVAQDLEDFGKLLHEMATAQPVLPGVTLPPVDLFRSDLPPSFSLLIMRLVNRERPDHYDDFEAVVSDLSRLSFPQPPTNIRTATMADAPEAAAGPALPPGRVLAGRFKIVRFIARGGMGDVYEAEDLELLGRVALKTVRPEIAGQPQAMDRFKREIQLARKVTHPNVCRIFDVFHDRTEAGDIVFLTMELLHGETLHQQLSARGRMATSEALPVIRQMAAGLAAAHDAGVIHRDFKSANVILVPAADGHQSRAVITDFGLARHAERHEGLATLSRSGDTLGTPAYMAPEQLDGGEITPATDVYAFGIVVYEMVTAKLPWDGDSALAVALKRLHELPPTPRVHVPDLDASWEAGILKCLERAPADRFRSVDDAVRALSSGEVPKLSASSAVAAARPRSRSRLLFPLVAAALVLAAAIAGVVAFRDPGNSTEVKSRRSIAVLRFKNFTGDADAAWLSTALAEMLTTELAAGETLRTIPGETVSRMSIDLSLPDSSGFAPDTLKRIRNYAGADIIVSGSYTVLNETPPKVRIDLRLQDSRQGTDLATVSQVGYTADLLALVSTSGAALREKLGLGKLQGSELQITQAALPATTAAARYYAAGLEKLRVFDAAGARVEFQNAIREDNRYALARAALATAWIMSGNPGEARQHADIALDLSKNLGREDRLVIEGRAREAALDWKKAADAYQALFSFFPDNLDYGIRFAEAQTSAGEAKSAMTTIASLRQLPAPDRDSPRIDLAEAHAAGALSDFARQQSMAARAAAKARERGASLLMAGAKLIEGGALANTGRLDAARTALEEARKIYAASGDEWDAVNASTNLGYVAMQAGRWSDAETIYKQSLASYQRLEDRKGEAAALTALGTLYRSRGAYPDALKKHEDALKIRTAVGDRVGEAMSRNNLANLYSLQGDAKAARDMFQSALEVFRETGDRNAVATVLSNLGDLVSEEGDLGRANELYEESRVTFEALGNQNSLAHVLSRLGDLALIAGDLKGARARHERALELRKKLGDDGGSGESRLALAQISLHESDPAAAESEARAAAGAFSAAARTDDEASALAVLARALLALNRMDDAARSLQQAEELSAKSNDLAVRLSIGVTAASMRSSRDAVAAMKVLEGLARQAKNANLVQLELEARLALAEVEIGTSRFPEGRRRLEALEAEASMKGYKYIAARAAAARRKLPALTA